MIAQRKKVLKDKREEERKAKEKRQASRRDALENSYTGVNRTSNMSLLLQVVNPELHEANGYLAANRDSSLTQEDSINNMAPSFDQSLVNISASMEDSPSEIVDADNKI